MNCELFLVFAVCFAIKTFYKRSADRWLVCHLMLSCSGGARDEQSAYTAKMSLCIDDKADVLEKLHSVRAKWRPIGLGLRVKHGDLDAIDMDQHDCQGKLESVVTTWLRSGQNCTWTTLMGVLRRDTVGEAALASELSQRVNVNGPPPETQEQQSALPAASNVPGRDCTTDGGPKTAVQENGEEQELGEDIQQGQTLRRQSTGDSAFGSEGRQSVSSPQTSLTSSLNVHSAELLGEIERKADDFSERFNKMADKALTLLKGVDPKEIIIILNQNEPSRRTRLEHGKFLDELGEAKNVVDLFSDLTPYWDHFNYHLLQKLVMKIPVSSEEKKKDADKLKEDMEQYVKEMELFRQDTPIDAYCEAVIPQEVKVPEYFKEMRTRHEKKKGELKTLQDVENFRKKIAYKWNLNDCLVFLKNIGKGSIILTWWIPESVAVECKEFTEADFDDKEDDAQSKEFSWIGAARDFFFGDPLVSAVKAQNAEEVERLIDEGMNPNVSIMSGWTALMEASRRGYADMAKLLLQKGANPNAANYEDWTALMAASRQGRYEIVEILLEHEANPDMQDNTGWSALLAAVNGRHERITHKLLKKGATPDIQSQSGITPLFLAIVYCPELISALLAKEQDLNKQDKYGETALIVACKEKNLKAVQALLELKADPNIASNTGDTALLVAVERQEVEIVDELLKAGADANKGSVPPLLLAANMNLPEITDLLMKHGANPEQKDKYGTSALEVAFRSNFAPLLQVVPRQLRPIRPQVVLRQTQDAISAFQTNLQKGPSFLYVEEKTRSWFESITSYIF